MRGELINLISKVELIEAINLLKTLETIGTIQKINPSNSENVVIDRVAKIDNITTLETLNTLNTLDTINKINPNPAAGENVVIDRIAKIDNITTLENLNTLGTIQKINPSDTENVVVDRVAKIDNITTLETLNTLNTLGTIQKINPQNTDNVVIDRVKTINTIQTINTLDTINTISKVNEIVAIDEIKWLATDKTRQLNAITNPFFDNKLVGWFGAFVKAESTEDPFIAFGYDAVMVSDNSFLAQTFDRPLIKSEILWAKIRCKADAAGDLAVLTIDQNGNLYTNTIAISTSWDTYNLPLPTEQTIAMYIYPDTAGIVPIRIKFISAPLKRIVYQAEKDRTITDITKVSTIKSFNISASASGNNTIWTPASGKAIRLKLVQYESDADVEVGLRFGSTGSLFARRITAGVMALNLVGCNVQGATDEKLNLYVGGAVNVKGFVLGEEV